MMIKIKLMVVLAEKELTLTKLSELTGIRYATLWNFAKGKTQAVGYETLDLICKTLGCEVGDILKFVPDASIRKAEPRKSLKKGGSRR